MRDNTIYNPKKYLISPYDRIQLISDLWLWILNNKIIINCFYLLSICKYVKKRTHLIFVYALWSNFYYPRCYIILKKKKNVNDNANNKNVMCPTLLFFFNIIFWYILLTSDIILATYTMQNMCILKT